MHIIKLTKTFFASYKIIIINQNQHVKTTNELS